MFMGVRAHFEGTIGATVQYLPPPPVQQMERSDLIGDLDVIHH